MGPTKKAAIKLPSWKQPHTYDTCLYTCMCVCVYVCMYVCYNLFGGGFLHLFVQVYVCMYVYACMYVCMYVCMLPSLWRWVLAQGFCLLIYIYIYIYICVCVCTYVCIPKVLCYHYASIHKTTLNGWNSGMHIYTYIHTHHGWPCLGLGLHHLSVLAFAQKIRGGDFKVGQNCQAHIMYVNRLDEYLSCSYT